MEGLLQKTRRLNKTLQNYGSDPVSFLELSKKLSDILQANVYIASKKGRVLGYKLAEGFECDIVQSQVVKTHSFPKAYNDNLLTITESKENISEFETCIFEESQPCNHADKVATIIPILSGGERLGTLVLARFGKDFTEEDLILAEYSATIVGMEILRSKTEEIEEEARKKSVVQMAIGTLSYSELEAMEHIFNELDGMEGLLVASKIADKVGITRSVIVNALRKFESAGVIESRSLGMKGTHIKILNDKLIEELDKATK
ncbi:GTP-sensing pleiotropic transcriptional regulator CodY [Tissierella creatinophila]|uniref:Global transcriptional regulator CodY n=1 Tax=Tissierella creatinophila DSM 6911 TaxID=1123403 RepID=A0A1U7M3F4_TISCR|nr:GTP-sensing pleiotropic transcriptional regulator CodY [Tissierella creatinophila]OLS01749.1 GTP-sensing transcriptional pleiotropic repressor CodY [Tissierella creatinophila DSM 6911]